MADNDAEFRAAIITYLRCKREACKEFFGTDEEFEQYVEFVLNGNGGTVQMFRVFYAMGGRYPTFKELHEPRPRLLTLNTLK
jgi:hypothetical protein